MKTVTILLLLLFASSAFGELTKEDLRTIIKEENAASEKRMKEYIDLKIDGVEKNLNARIDGVEKSLNARIDGVEKSLNGRIDALDKNLSARIDALDKSLNGRIDDIWTIMIALIALITAAIAVPQILMAYRERGKKEMETRQAALQTEIQQLRERLAALENTPS